jgi:hypothetical protein
MYRGALAIFARRVLLCGALHGDLRKSSCLADNPFEPHWLAKVRSADLRLTIADCGLEKDGNRDRKFVLASRCRVSNFEFRFLANHQSTMLR